MLCCPAKAERRRGRQPALYVPDRCSRVSRRPGSAANGDSETGYRILVDGVAAVVGGTSAVAPLWAGLISRLNQAKGARLGFLHNKLYAITPAKGFRDIVLRFFQSGRRSRSTEQAPIKWMGPACQRSGERGMARSRA